MSSELKTCPFCGSEAAIYESGQDYREENGVKKSIPLWNVECVVCGVGYSYISQPYEETLKLWNRRTKR